MKDPQCMLPSWDRIHELAYEVADKVMGSGFKPDTVVALARGGVVPARIICDALVLSDYVSIKVDHWGITAAKDGKARLRRPVSWDFSGKKILVVDDITDTGESLMLAVDVLKGMNPEGLRTATLYHIDHSKFRPDFFAEEIKWHWVIFPWNRHEDLVNLVGKIAEDGMAPGQVQGEFKSKHGVDVPLSAIERAMDSL
jgi:hypoxanthine phosphoribosyltransferase